MSSENSKIKAALAVGGVVVLVVAGLALVLPGRGDDEAMLVVKQGTLERPVPGQTLPAGGRASVAFETNLGSFVVELDGKRSPIAADNFAYLARNGFYDGLGFHRIVPGFVIQGGDPRGDGTGDPGYLVVDPPARGTIYEPGTVAMAKSGTDPRGAAGSQFFIVTGDASFLPPTFSVLGTVVGSEATLDALDTVPLAPRDNEVSNPLETVYIESVTIEG